VILQISLMEPHSIPSIFFSSPDSPSPRFENRSPSLPADGVLQKRFPASRSVFSPIRRSVVTPGGFVRCFCKGLGYELFSRPVPGCEMAGVHRLLVESFFQRCLPSPNTTERRFLSKMIERKAVVALVISFTFAHFFVQPFCSSGVSLFFFIRKRSRVCAFHSRWLSSGGTTLFL